MTRRMFLTQLALGGLLAPPLAVEAQAPAKAPTIGMLHTLSPDHAEGRTQLDVFRQALRELGYVEGRNIVIEHRWAEGKMERLPTLATELVRLKVDIVVTGATPYWRRSGLPEASLNARGKRWSRRQRGWPRRSACSFSS